MTYSRCSRPGTDVAIGEPRVGAEAGFALGEVEMSVMSIKYASSANSLLAARDGSKSATRAMIRIVLSLVVMRELILLYQDPTMSFRVFQYCRACDSCIGGT